MSGSRDGAERGPGAGAGARHSGPAASAPDLAVGPVVRVVGPGARTLAPAYSAPDERPATRAARPGGPAHWWSALHHTPVTAWNEDVTDWAAALTYYAVLALFPVLLVTLSVVGLSIPSATPGVISQFTRFAPAPSRELLVAALRQTSQQHSAAWLLVVFGGISALWSGSSYLAVFRRAMHAMYRETSNRPVWKAAPLTLLTTVTVIVLLLASSIALVLTGDLARRLGQVLHLGDAESSGWAVLRWLALAVLAIVLILILYRSGPRRTRPIRRMAPGGALAVLLLLAVSLGFTFYASHVSTYHRIYGSLSGVVVFLIWLWLSNLVLLLGALFNRELHPDPPSPAAPGDGGVAAAPPPERPAGGRIPRSDL